MKYYAIVYKNEVNLICSLIVRYPRLMVKLKRSDITVYNEPICIRTKMCVGVYIHVCTHIYRMYPAKMVRNFSQSLGETLKGRLEDWTLFYFINCMSFFMVSMYYFYDEKNPKFYKTYHKPNRLYLKDFTVTREDILPVKFKSKNI